MSLIKDVKAKAVDGLLAAGKKAIASAPDAWMPGAHPDPLAEHRNGLVGAAISRVDGPEKVQGLARFAAEIPLEGMLYAAVLFSTIPRGRIAALDTSAARSSPGVVFVMTHENAPRLKTLPPFTKNLHSAAADDVPVMQDDRIRWNGQPVAVVLAETQEQADHALSLLHPAYEPEPASTSFADARARGVEVGNFMGLLKDEVGDAEAALSAAAVHVDAVYSTPRQNHNALELHAVTVAWDGDELLVHDATQKLAHTAWSLAHAFDVKREQVRVLSPYVGGGFGGKSLWQHQILAAAASRAVGRPVRLVLSREGVYRVVGGRTLTEQRVAIGAASDGRFEALIHTGVAAMGQHNNMPEPFINPARSMYAAGAFHLEVDTVRLDMVANTFMRGPGEAMGTFALESAIDELAVKLKIDPIELRLRNEPEREPISGLPFSTRQVKRVFKDGAERFGWQHRHPTPGQRREGEWLIGMGVAAGSYPYTRMPGGAARITLRNDGHARVEIGGQEMGMGTATVHAQVVAARLGLPMSQVVVHYGDSSLPGTVMAVGSQQTAAFGAAIASAHSALVQKLLKLVKADSPLHGLGVGEVEGLDEGLVAIGDRSRRETYRSILTQSERSEVTVEAAAPLPLEFLHWAMHSHAALFCEVKVSAVTGETRVTRFLGSFDCGRILNAKTAASQLRGGIIMGLGLALMEETQFDERTGRIVNASLSEYHVPVHLDVPPIDVIWTDIADPHAPMGAHGIGELGITGTTAAVANAIYNATGRRCRSLPMTLDKVLDKVPGGL
ncbi:MAG TPA: xanthine dehydrogenase family protein molybdopterin-binding subunit [Burkholderiaceae bacterium]|jgi:xanthine dehydrogenase YagR molybdenum-binding subunit